MTAADRARSRWSERMGPQRVAALTQEPLAVERMPRSRECDGCGAVMRVGWLEMGDGRAYCCSDCSTPRCRCVGLRVVA